MPLRLGTLRRELYLESAEANVRGLGYLGTLPQADFTKPDADAPLRNVLALGAQLQLVVRPDTAPLISDLISAYAELHLKLIAKVMPMHKVRIDINICNEQYENTQVEIKRLLAEMANLNESGQRDPVRFGQLNQSFDFANGRAGQLADERSAHWAEFNALQREYMKDLIPELKRLGELQIHVLVELRRELDVGGEIETFKNIMETQMQRVEQAMNEFDRNVFGVGTPPL